MTYISASRIRRSQERRNVNRRSRLSGRFEFISSKADRIESVLGCREVFRIAVVVDAVRVGLLEGDYLASLGEGGGIGG